MMFEQVDPQRVGALTNMVAVTGGADFTIALQADGTVWGWGDNFYGNLADASVTDHLGPVRALTAPTATSLVIGAITPEPGNLGEAYTVTAGVNFAIGSPIQGTVSVSDGTGSVCLIVLPARECQLVTNTSGLKTITAIYSGDGGSLTGSSAFRTHAIKSAVNLTIAQVVPEPSVVGQTYTVRSPFHPRLELLVERCKCPTVPHRACRHSWEG